jgi:sensor histidine kinase regulating citrate/malate metabolism
MLQSQASMTIVDAAGKPIGAITIGINLDEL